MKDEPRVGVFVCHCGTNIGGVVDVPEVVEYAKTLPYVVYADRNLYTCSEEGLNNIRDTIKEYNLNRVVVASCTPRTHEPLFRVACQEGGLNPYLFEMANIREHCSWVHHDSKEATEKAKDIVRMAVARSLWLEPQEEPELEIKDSSLVIGGGISGLVAAISLADQGFKVYLVEKEAELGGLVRQLYKLYPTLEDTSEILNPHIEEAKNHRNIEVHTSTTIKDIEGYVGNFHVTAIKNKEQIEFDVGTIIVATGAWNYHPPEGNFQYGVLDGVMTQLELEELLKEGKLERPEIIVMIQCVGSRVGEIWSYELVGLFHSQATRLLSKILGARGSEEGWAYCSKICCMNAIKNAILIKEQFPESEVTILYQDLRTYKEYEDFYRRARKLEVRFLKYIYEIPPEISEAPGNKLRVSFYDPFAGEEMSIICDKVALSTPLIPSKDGILLAKKLKIPLDQNGFLMEAHVKLRPIDTQIEGIFLAGTAAGPKDISESIVSAKAAAARASILMGNKVIKTEALTAVVNQDLCIGCGLCEELCPYGAHIVKDGKSTVIEALCKGCGVCVVACPQKAISAKHYTDDQILAAVKNAFTEQLT